MPKHNFPSDKGDLIIKYSVKMPTSLTDAQRVKIRELLKTDL